MIKILLVCLLFYSIPSLSQIEISSFKNVKNEIPDNENDTSQSLISLNTYFTYMFIENTSTKYTNAKGFGIDLQIDQNNYTSWLIGFNISFYKGYSNIDTFNLSTLNLFAGPKFYFSTSRSSMYARINTGVTFFSEHANSGISFSVSLFPAIGFEHNFSKIFRLFIEPSANLNIDLTGIDGHFSINTGLISSF
jgi:hypothetical protein